MLPLGSDFTTLFLQPELPWGCLPPIPAALGHQLLLESHFCNDFTAVPQNPHGVLCLSGNWVMGSSCSAVRKWQNCTPRSSSTP